MRTIYFFYWFWILCCWQFQQNMHTVNVVNVFQWFSLRHLKQIPFDVDVYTIIHVCVSSFQSMLVPPHQWWLFVYFRKIGKFNTKILDSMMCEYIGVVWGYKKKNYNKKCFTSNFMVYLCLIILAMCVNCIRFNAWERKILNCERR